MSTAGTPMGEGMVPSQHGEQSYKTYEGEREVHTHDARRDRHQRRRNRVDKDTAAVIAGGSIFEIIAGAGALTLGILGLAGLLPFTFLTIAIICAGGGLMFAGGSIATKYEEVLGAGQASSGVAEASGGITAEMAGGAAGVVLGILALLGVEAVTLTAVALIVLGGAMAFGAGAVGRLSRLIIAASGAPLFKQRVARESVRSASALQLIAGVGAAVLGILTLLGVGSGTVSGLTLSLIAVLALGGGLLLSGLAIGSKMLNMLYQASDDDRDERYDSFERHEEFYPVYRQYRHDPDSRPA